LRAPASVGALALAAVVALATPAPGPLGAQQVGATSRTVELGADAAAEFGLGDVSSVNVTLPGSRFRAGFFMNPRWSIEPAAGFSYNKVENEDGNLRYDLQLGALYHFRPFAVVAADGTGDVIVRVRSTYLRPFVQLVGFDSGNTDDSEVSAGAGLGIKVPWRTRLWWRLEANAGYGFDNEAFRLGAVAGLSYFIR
jgi:hypothetical protein